MSILKVMMLDFGVKRIEVNWVEWQGAAVTFRPRDLTQGPSFSSLSFSGIFFWGGHCTS